MGKMMIYVAGIMIWALYDIQQGTRMGVFFFFFWLATSLLHGDGVGDFRIYGSIWHGIA